MPALAFALAYAGLVALALSMNRHARDVLQQELTDAQRRGARIFGWSLLALTLILLARVSGWPLGTVQWFGTLTAGAATFVPLLSYLPRTAAALAPALLAAAVIHDRYTAWLSP